MWDYGENNRGPLMAEVAIIMAALCVVSVALRSYTMARILKRCLIEDYLAVFTCVSRAFASSVVCRQPWTDMCRACSFYSAASLLWWWSACPTA